MAWPFASVVAPNFEVGPGAAIPTSPASIQATQCWLIGIHLSNPTSAGQIVTITNAAGKVLDTVTVPAGEEREYDWTFRPALGVIWSADAVGLLGHLWGYA